MQLVFRAEVQVLTGKFPSSFEEKQTRFGQVLQEIYNNKLET